MSTPNDRYLTLEHLRTLALLDVDARLYDVSAPSYPTTK